MSVWVSYGPAIGAPDLSAEDHDYPGHMAIDVAYTTMQEPEIIRLSMYRDSSDGGRSGELTRATARELIKRLTWALECATGEVI